jgi:hypothetical protein
MSLCTQINSPLASGSLQTPLKRKPSKSNSNNYFKFLKSSTSAWKVTDEVTCFKKLIIHKSQSTKTISFPKTLSKIRNTDDTD